MKELPKKNDVLLIYFANRWHLVYVHSTVVNFVLIGSKNWSFDSFRWLHLPALKHFQARKVGRCIRIWPFKFFILDEK